LLSNGNGVFFIFVFLFFFMDLGTGFNTLKTAKNLEKSSKNDLHICIKKRIMWLKVVKMWLKVSQSGENNVSWRV